MGWKNFIANVTSDSCIADIKLTARTTAPIGWLICDGSAVSRILYVALFKAIGTTYGIGDGTTTFNLPDMRGRVATGYDSTQAEFNALGKNGGEKTHTLTISEMPSHGHTYPAHYSESAGWMNGQVQMTDRGVEATNNVSNTGGGLAHNNLQPFTTLN